jgi:ABC-type sugar transport system ATPase subunit
MPHDPRELLTASHIRRRFGATQALADANLTLRAGEVHALLGENGAGKSTLVKILVGADRLDGGALAVDGQPVSFASVTDAVAHGIVPIYQQLSLLPDLSVTENLFAFELAGGPGWRRTDRRWRAEARRALDTVGLAIDPDCPVGDLSLAERQLVEIGRSVLVDCKVLVLDEPTTALTRGEVERLFGVVRDLRDRGRAVLFISHRLDEVMTISDRISVLRNGRSEMEGHPVQGLTADEVVRAMVGREVEQAGFAGGSHGAPVLRAQALSAPGAFEDVALTVHAGEVLAVVGLVGSGALEMAEALSGARPSAGVLTVNGRPVRLGSRRDALKAGVGYLPGDRDRDGVFPTLRVLDNGSACVLDVIARRGFLARGRERRHLLPLLRSLAVKPNDPAAPITGLSGGNQQKVLLARTLSRGDSRVLVVVEPTRGVDIGSRRDIHQALRDDATRGAAVVLASTDLDEVVTVADRVLVMREGRIAAALPASVGTEALLSHMTGAAG